MTHARRSIATLVTLTGLIGASASAVGGEVARSAIALTPRFELHSDFAVNLHDALLEAGRDRNFQRPALFEEGEEATCFAELPDYQRTAWSQAVAYYAEVVAAGRWTGEQQFNIRLAVVGLDGLVSENDRPVVEIAAGMRAAAAPAYRACRWTAQDAENRRWIAQVMPLLEAHGQEIAARLAVLYDKPLGGLPIRVDLVETVNWSGASTIFLNPEGGHIWISNETPEGPESLETVFHEASHILMSPRSPVPQALEAAAKRLELELPRNLWHGLLFYATGEAVRRVLADAGEPGYVPMTFAQDIFDEFHGPLKEAWSAYLDGGAALDEAAEALVREATADD